MKSSKMWIRLAVSALILCMMLGMLAACTEPKDPDTKPGVTTDPNAPGVDDNGYILDSVPAGLNFRKQVHILGWTNQQNRTVPPENAVDNVSRAVVDRNAAIEERLNVELVWEFIPGQYDTSSKPEKTEFVKRVETDSENDKEIDLVIAYNLVPYRMSYKGILSNLADTKYIDLEAPWWPKEYLENMVYKGTVWALVDSVSVGTLQNLSCIYFDNDLLARKKIASPYDLVEDNNWTITTLREITKDTWEDTDNSKTKSEGDTFGVCTSTYARLTSWYFGIGVRLSELNDEGNMRLTGSDTTDISAALKKISELFSTNDGLVNDSSQYVMFKDRRACFYLSVFHMAESIMKDELEISYGVAPNPKMESGQSRYYTHLPNTHDAWCIPASAQNQDCSSAVLELMASESYRKVTYVYYEQNLKTRYAPDERLADMYDLIRENIVFDYVYIHKESSLGADFDNAMRECIKNPTQDWINKWDSIGPSQEEKFTALMDAYDTVIGG